MKGRDGPHPLEGKGLTSAVQALRSASVACLLPQRSQVVRASSCAWAVASLSTCSTVPGHSDERTEGGEEREDEETGHEIQRRCGEKGA